MTAAAPRLIVEVRGGRSGATKAVVPAGKALRFGRTTLADVTVPHDETLSGVHFELSWDGARARLRDRNSHLGTFLGGLPVTKADVPHGGWIRAGKTDFMVYVEGKTPPREAADGETGNLETGNLEAGNLEAGNQAPKHAAEEARRAAAKNALAELRAEAGREPLYTIVDGARDERILELLRESVEPHQSLYEGVDGEALDDVAPYLAGPMRADSKLLDKLVLEGWGKRWGIYLTSRVAFKEVRRHFRRFLMVEMERSGERVYFRFYDPAAMRLLGRVSNPYQNESLLQPIGSQIVLERADLALGRFPTC